MPTAIATSSGEASGDLIAYTIGIDDDVDIDNTENCDTAAAPKRAYALLTGDMVALTGRITFTGANASLGFTLPNDLRSKFDEHLVIASNDGGVSKACDLTIVAATGVVAITQQDAAAFAATDFVDLSGGYLRG